MVPNDLTNFSQNLLLDPIGSSFKVVLVVVVIVSDHVVVVSVSVVVVSDAVAVVVVVVVVLLKFSRYPHYQHRNSPKPYKWME